MRTLALVVPVAALQAGCANTVYRHPEYTPERWAKDKYECERDTGYFGGWNRWPDRDAGFLRSLPRGPRLDEDARIKLKACPSPRHESPRLFELLRSQPFNFFLHLHVVSNGELSRQLIQTHPQCIADRIRMPSKLGRSTCC
jgi:hypothetical protein